MTAAQNKDELLDMIQHGAEKVFNSRGAVGPAADTDMGDDDFVCLECSKHGRWLRLYVVQTVYRIIEAPYRRPTSQEIAEYKRSMGLMNPAMEARRFFLGI